MPELMKVYKELFGKEYKWEEDSAKWKLGRLIEDEEQKTDDYGYDDSSESVGIEYDVQFLDDNRDIVPKEEATQVIRKGYQNNELIIFEHLERIENDPKKYLNDISWSN